MTLKDFVLKKKEDAKFWTKKEDLELTPEQLMTMVDELKQCEEFKDTEIEIMNLPAALITLGDKIDTISAKTIILHEGTKFGKKCYLYKISLTPELYEKDFINTTPGSYITPVIYNPESFVPEKKIVLVYDMIGHQDDIAFGNINYRKSIHDTLDNILDNMESYEKVPNHRCIIVRGHFEYYSVPNEAKKIKI
jgi:hypothetical protein